MFDDCYYVMLGGVAFIVLLVLFYIIVTYVF